MLKIRCVMHLQFKDEDHLIFIFISVVEVDQLVMVQVIHDVNLFPKNKNKILV